MCGIAGFQGDFPPQLLERMNACISHRGPDGAGQSFFPAQGNRVATGLAHRRLAIIDLSVDANQPLVPRCDRCGDPHGTSLSLIYNGELYNYRPLRDELIGKGHDFRTSSDTEVLLHLYAEEGPAMLARLNGIFALAIRDDRETGRPDGIARGDVLVARDHLGVKPLYFAATAEGVLFASELKALLQHDGVKRELNPVALHQYLAYLWTPGPQTMLLGVEKLEPGSAFILHEGAIGRRWSYYQLPFGKPRFDVSEAEMAEGLRQCLEQAVDRQLIADVPVGAFLSGGLDSSAVVAMMKKLHPDQRPVCYGIGFEGDGSIDGSPADMPYARSVARHLGVDLREIVVKPDIIENLERMLYFLDEPQADPAPINVLLIAEQARTDGMKVLLSGAGGDDIFSGYRRHQAVRVDNLWGRLPAVARRAISAPAQRAAAGRWRGARSGIARRMVKLLQHSDLTGDARTVSHFWWSGEDMRRGLYSPSFSEQVSGEETASPLLESLARIEGERDSLNRMLYLECRHFLPDHNLNYTDKMGMAAGVEIRVPLLDIELVEFAARIPPSAKQKGRVGKAIFKKAMEPYLPREVIYRAKTGFGAPLRSWLNGALRDRVDDTLSKDSLERRGLFSPAAVQRLIALDRAGRVDGAYTIFALVCLELWCRLFLDAAPAPGTQCRAE
jgi:asparagine synthase (glutamine-hydrolysing)